MAGSNKRPQIDSFGFDARSLFLVGRGGEEEGDGGGESGVARRGLEARNPGVHQQRISIDGSSCPSSASHGRRATLHAHGDVVLLPLGLRCRPDERIFLVLLTGSIAEDTPSGLLPGGAGGARVGRQQIGGGDGKGPDCVPNLYPRVFSAFVVSLSWNSLSLRVFLVKLYPPL